MLKFFLFALGLVTIEAQAQDDFLSLLKSSALPPQEALRPYSWQETQVDAGGIPRARLQEIFSHYLYGYTPPLPTISPQLVSRQFIKLPEGPKAELWDYDVFFADSMSIRLSIFLPRGSTKVPLFIGINKCGNHTVVELPELTPRKLGFQMRPCAAPEFQPKEHKSFWSVAEILAKGYGFATFHESDIAPDDPMLYRSRALSLYTEKKYSDEHSWGALAAWSWGLRSLLPLLQQHSGIDPEALIAIGNSRRGKAVLLAAAFDKRIAMVVPHQSGLAGLAALRNPPIRNFLDFYTAIIRENLFLMHFNFPHWLNGYSRNFRWNSSRIPLEQNLLIGMVWPRPILSTEGLKDHWARYNVSLANLKSVEPRRTYMIQGDQAFPTDTLFGQARLDTGHSLTPAYWKKILEFTDLQRKR